MKGERPPATRASSITSWTSQTGRRTGSPSSRRSTRRSCWLGPLPRPAISTATRRPSARLRSVVDALYRRVDWPWAQNGGPTVTHGWTPERGFLRYRWEGYNEALLLYVLGLGSPTHPLPRRAIELGREATAGGSSTVASFSTRDRCSSTSCRTSGSTFAGIRDASMRERDIDYFENSRRATRRSSNTPSATQEASRATASTPGASPPATGPGPATRRIGASTALLRLPGARHSVWPGRRHDRPVGGDRLVAVRARDRPAHDRAHRSRRTRG